MPHYNDHVLIIRNLAKLTRLCFYGRPVKDKLAQSTYAPDKLIALLKTNVCIISQDPIMMVALFKM